MTSYKLPIESICLSSKTHASSKALLEVCIVIKQLSFSNPVCMRAEPPQMH